MITRATLSTIEQGLPKYRSMLAGNTAYSPGAYENIASATGSGSSTITFSGIPSTFQHLQLRMYLTTNADTYFSLRLNGDTGFNYTRFYFYADGGSGYAVTDNGSNRIYFLYGISGGASFPAVGIWDIHNYTSTTQKKTIRGFGGVDINSTANEIFLSSNAWNTTPVAITSITLEAVGGTLFASDNYVGLYGIKGA